MDMILKKSLTLPANLSVKVSKNEIERGREREGSYRHERKEDGMNDNGKEREYKILKNEIAKLSCSA